MKFKTVLNTEHWFQWTYGVVPGHQEDSYNVVSGGCVLLDNGELWAWTANMAMASQTNGYQEEAMWVGVVSPDGAERKFGDLWAYGGTGSDFSLKSTDTFAPHSSVSPKWFPTGLFTDGTTLYVYQQNDKTTFNEGVAVFRLDPDTLELEWVAFDFTNGEGGSFPWAYKDSHDAKQANANLFLPPVYWNGAFYFWDTVVHWVGGTGWTRTLRRWDPVGGSVSTVTPALNADEFGSRVEFHMTINPVTGLPYNLDCDRVIAIPTTMGLASAIYDDWMYMVGYSGMADASTPKTSDYWYYTTWIRRLDLNNPEGIDEVVEVWNDATGGTFTLGDGSDNTSAINHNASAATIKTRLETDIAAITTATVTGAGTVGDPWVITHNVCQNPYGLAVDGAGLTGGAASLTVTVKGHPMIETLYYGYGPGAAVVAGPTDPAMPRDWYSDFSETPNGTLSGGRYLDYITRSGTPDLLGFYPQGSASGGWDWTGFGADPDGLVAGSACVVGDELIFTNGTTQSIFAVSVRGQFICAMNIPTLLQAVEDNGGPIRHDRSNPLFRTIANAATHDHGHTHHNAVQGTERVGLDWLEFDGGIPAFESMTKLGVTSNENAPGWAGKVLFTSLNQGMLLSFDPYPVVPDYVPKGYLVKVLEPKGRTDRDLTVQFSFEGRVLRGYGPAVGMEQAEAPEEIILR